MAYGSTSTSTSPDITAVLEMVGEITVVHENALRTNPLFPRTLRWKPRRQDSVTQTSASRFVLRGRRLGDEPTGGDESTMSMLEGEEGVRADDDYAKGEDYNTSYKRVAFTASLSMYGR